MSQLNSGIPKNHDTRNMIIFLLIFTIICVSVTVYLIYEANTSIPETYIGTGEPVVIKDMIEDCDGIKSLEETFKENAIKITEEEFNDIPISSYHKYKVTVRYLQIDGLKDEELEKSINRRLKNEALNSYTKEELNDPNIEYIDVCTIQGANYSNVLSVCIYKQIAYKDNTYKEEANGININLINGKDIVFEEIFVTNAPIKNILTQSAYNSIIREKFFNDIEDIDLSKKDYSYIEDEVLKVLSYYNSGKEFEFSFSRRYIEAYINGYTIYIKMRDIYDQIAIYNRYKEYENIYDGKYTKDYELLIFTESYNPWENYYYNVKSISDNLFVDIRLRKYEQDELTDSEIKQLKKYFDGIVEEYSNLNKGKGKYLVIDASMKDRYTVEIYRKYFVTDNETYSSELYPYILTELQDPYGSDAEGYVYYEALDENLQKKISFEEKRLEYNIETKTTTEVVLQNDYENILNEN